MEKQKNNTSTMNWGKSALNLKMTKQVNKEGEKKVDAEISSWVNTDVKRHRFSRGLGLRTLLTH
jgi:hypothetical protein